MLNRKEKLTIEEEIALAINGMEKALEKIPNCSQNLAVVSEQFNLNRGVYIGCMDFVYKYQPSLYEKCVEKYGKRELTLHNEYGKVFGKIFNKCK